MAMIRRYRIPGLEWEGAPDGALIYFQQERAYLLPIPSDWAEKNAADDGYALRIAAGLPAWRASGLAAVEGVMSIESEPSRTSGSLRDADGNLMYAFPE
jgi:hypothetical protein